MVLSNAPDLKECQRLGPEELFMKAFSLQCGSDLKQDYLDELLDDSEDEFDEEDDEMAETMTHHQVLKNV